MSSKRSTGFYLVMNTILFKFPGGKRTKVTSYHQRSNPVLRLCNNLLFIYHIVHLRRQGNNITRAFLCHPSSHISSLRDEFTNRLFFLPTWHPYGMGFFHFGSFYNNFTPSGLLNAILKPSTIISPLQ